MNYRDHRYSLRAIAGPYAEPVSLQEMKDHLRVDGDDEDALISAWVTAARKWVEDATRRQIVTAKFRMTLDGFPRERRMDVDVADRQLAGTWREIAVPGAPLQSVASITYVDEGGTTQTLDPATYRVDVDSEPGRITPAYGSFWPFARCETGSVVITFTGGHMTPFTVDVDADTLTACGRTFANGDVLRLTNSGGELPPALAGDTDETGVSAEFYVVNATGGGATFQLAATANGTAINIDAGGQGTHFASNPSSDFSDVEGLRAAIKLIVGHWNENREAVGTVGGAIALAVRSLIWQKRVFL